MAILRAKAQITPRQFGQKLRTFKAQTRDFLAAKNAEVFGIHLGALETHWPLHPCQPNQTGPQGAGSLIAKVC